MLDLSPGASEREVRKAHHRSVLAVHPDRIDRVANPKAWEAANALLRRLNEASSVLLNPEPAVSAPDLDELWGEAARIMVTSGQGSVSLLQRRLSVGYARAARLMDQLEDAQIVGPFEGSAARAVLLDPADLDAALRSRGFPTQPPARQEAPLPRQPTARAPQEQPSEHTYTAEGFWLSMAGVFLVIVLPWLLSNCGS